LPSAIPPEKTFRPFREALSSIAWAENFICAKKEKGRNFQKYIKNKTEIIEKTCCMRELDSLIQQVSFSVHPVTRPGRPCHLFMIRSNGSVDNIPLPQGRGKLPAI
jgi:hypothetical protein